MVEELVNIPYTTSKDQKKHALVLPMSFSYNDLSQEQLRVLMLLSRAVNSMNKIFVRQQHEQGLALYNALRKAEESEEDPEKKELLRNYNLIFCARNGPWNHTDGLNQKFPLEEIPEVLKGFEEVLLANKSPLGVGLYPEDFREDEANNWSDEKKNLVNSLVVRDEDDSAQVVVNEEYFREDLTVAITALDILTNFLEENKSIHGFSELLSYVRAKKKELETGSYDDRLQANKAWLNNHCVIDFVLSTALETYVDRVFGVRGEVDSGVFVVNKEFQGFTQRFSKLLPRLEERAPWSHKKTIHQDNIPKLRFVDVVTWSGGYDSFPATVLAQSLPNEQEFRENHGSVNLVYANIQEAISKSTKEQLSRFIQKSEWDSYCDTISHISLLMTAAHEIGHASGGVTINEDPGELFGSEYSVMEEARAELFSLWALPILVEEQEITSEEEMSGYYSMLLTMIGALQQEPKDHSGSRNIMFHYFLEQGAVVEEQGERVPLFRINKEKMRDTTTKLLKIIGDIRATGDKESLKELRDKYLRTDRREEFEEYLKDLPQGRLLIFPEIKEEDGKLTVKPVNDFRRQQRVLDAYL